MKPAFKCFCYPHLLGTVPSIFKRHRSMLKLRKMGGMKKTPNILVKSPKTLKEVFEVKLVYSGRAAKRRNL